MGKRKAKPSPPPSTMKPLPRSGEALALLLRSTESMLAFLVPDLQAQQARLRDVQKTLRCPPQSPDDLQQFLKEADFLERVTEASRSRLASGGPPWTSLKPYLKSAGLDAISDKHKLAAERMRTLIPQGAKHFPLEAWKPCAVAFCEIVAAERAVVSLISELQNSIIAALDETPRTAADSKTDKKKNLPSLIPRNKKITRLAEKIKRDRGPNVSMRSIAIDFTNGDEKQADSLLRQLRRFRHLLD